MKRRVGQLYERGVAVRGSGNPGFGEKGRPQDIGAVPTGIDGNSDMRRKNSRPSERTGHGRNIRSG